MNISLVLKEIKMYKSRASELYEWLQTVFVENSEARSFFFRMGLRERSHIDLVRFQIRTVAKNPRDFMDADVDLNFFQERRERIDSFMKTSPSLHEALLFISRLEKGSPLCYCSLVMKQSNREFAKLLNNLSLTCNMHGEEFRDFITQRIGTEYRDDCLEE